MDKRTKARVLAMQVLYAWQANKKRISLEGLLEFNWVDKAPAEETKLLARLLVTGTAENIKIIDEMIAEHLENRSFSRIDRVDLAILRLSVYSLRFQNAEPAPLIISSALTIATIFSSEDSFRFINGMLDAVRKKVRPGEPPHIPPKGGELCVASQGGELCVASQEGEVYASTPEEKSCSSFNKEKLCASPEEVEAYKGELFDDSQKELL